MIRRLTGSAWALLALGAWACGSSSSDSCARGAEKCACYPNHTCNAGLTCFSNVCVVDPASSGGASSQGGRSSDGGTGIDAGEPGAGGTPEGGSPSLGGAGNGGTTSGGRASGGAANGGAANGGNTSGAGEAGVGGDGAGAASGGSASGGNPSGGSASGGKSSGGASSGGASSGGASSGGASSGGSSGTGGCGSGTAPNLFFDDFECGSSKWTVQPAGTFALSVDGTSVFQRSALDPSLAIAIAGSNWTRISVRARVKALTFGAATTLSYVALYAAYVDANNYSAVAWQGNGTVAHKYRSGGGGGETYSQDLTIAAGAWHTLGIDVSGATTTVYLDGMLLSTGVANSPLPAGRIALGVYNATASFDDVIVTSN